MTSIDKCQEEKQSRERKLSVPVRPGAILGRIVGESLFRVGDKFG